MDMLTTSYTTAIYHSTEPPSLAKGSCSTCRTQKRQCDRLLPQCNRCRRRGNLCHYEDLYCHKDLQYQERYRFVHKGPHSSNLASVAQLQGASQMAVSQMCLPSDGWELQITNEVISILPCTSTDLDGIVEMSRTSVCSWLPIIDVPELAWKVNQLQREPSADVATLLLGVHLINQISTSAVTHFDEDSTPLLVIFRRLFLTIFMKRKESLETVQAGIMLSVLQLNAGQLPDASLTITLCTNITFQLSLNHVHVADTGQYSRLDIKRRNIWYAIVLLDRLIYAADPSSGAAMAVSDDSLDRDFSQNSSACISPPSQLDEPFDSFILQTQAAHILGKVWAFIRTPSICCRNCLEARFRELDCALRVMGITAVKLSAEGAGKLPCVASPLVFTAMATLYQFKLGSDVHIKQGQLLTSTPAYLAFVSVMSMVRDIARARLPNSGLVTFPGVISLYTVAMAALKLSHLYPDSAFVVNDILDTLRILGRRSKLAVFYLERLNATMLEWRVAAKY